MCVVAYSTNIYIERDTWDCRVRRHGIERMHRLQVAVISLHDENGNSQRLQLQCRLLIILVPQTWESPHPSSHRNFSIGSCNIILFDVLSRSPDSLLVISSNGGSKIVILPFSGRNSSLHHETIHQSSFDPPLIFHSLDLFQSSTSGLRDEEEDESD